MTCDAVDYLYRLSDPELLLWFQAFGGYPTHDRRQRRRLDAAVAAAAGESRPALGLHERQAKGEAAEVVTVAAGKVA